MSDTAKPSRQARILEIFDAGGPMSPKTLADSCLRMGVFDEDWEATIRFRAAKRECTKALQEAKDERGIRRYGQTTRTDPAGAAVWAQRDLWTIEDYRLNVAEHLRNRDANHDAAVQLANECRDRHGVAIPVPIPGRAA